MGHISLGIIGVEKRKRRREMKTKLLKVMVSVMLVTVCMTAFAFIVNAETKPFNVTASNMFQVQSPDPLTPRALKRNDGDDKWYVTCTSMNGSCSYVNFYIYHIYQGGTAANAYQYSNPLKYYRSDLGRVQKRYYGSNPDCPGNDYYYMKCVPEYNYAYINVIGRFTP